MAEETNVTKGDNNRRNVRLHGQRIRQSLTLWTETTRDEIGYDVVLFFVLFLTCFGGFVVAFHGRFFLSLSVLHGPHFATETKQGEIMDKSRSAAAVPCNTVLGEMRQLRPDPNITVHDFFVLFSRVEKQKKT